MLILDPSAQREEEAEQLRRTLPGLAGATVGFIDNAKPNFNYLVDELAERLVSKYGVKNVVKLRKRGASMPAPQAIIDQVSEECSLVITGSGD
jgi:hypothetical protein